MSELSAHAGLILASTSVYRKQLLERLGLPFAAVRPEVDESPLLAESGRDLAIRLARSKALAVATISAGAWVIGSDQVACFDGRLLGKPGDHPRAAEQLREMSGRAVEFVTAICLAGPQEQCFEATDSTTVYFRDLDDAQIERYLMRERPYDCAGSFKSEGLGIALFDRIESQDPTALIGLPLIATAKLLRQAGFAVP